MLVNVCLGECCLFETRALANIRLTMFLAFKLSFAVEFWPFLAWNLFWLLLKNLSIFFSNRLVTLEEMASM
jgi:hypothetical protein